MGRAIAKYKNNQFSSENEEPESPENALCPNIAKLTEDMTKFAKTPQLIYILDEEGNQV